MPRKKINIEPQDLKPVDDPLEETIPEVIPEIKPPKPNKTPKPERIMPEMDWKPEKPKQGIHVSGFLMLFLATALAAFTVYYWPDFGVRDFMHSDAQVYTPFVKHREPNTVQDPNAHKTYSSSAYNFEIIYPATASVVGDFDIDKMMTIQDLSTETPLKLEFVAKPIVNARGDIAATMKVVSAKDIKFNGYDAREIIVGVENVGPIRILLMSRPGGTFKITAPVDTYSDILATFKFTDNVQGF